MGKSKSILLPLIPLPKDQVLLPGISLRIPFSNRPDITALLAHLYSTAKTPRREEDAIITVGCLPVGSPYLSADGKKLISDGNKKVEDAETVYIHPADASKEDLFEYGCIGKVTGLQGQRQGEFSLIVEGVQRFVVEGFVKERPYFEARVVPFIELDVDPMDSTMQSLFADMKQLSREFLALVRLSSLLPKQSAPSLTPLLARRLELYIARRDVQDAGSLSDFMANVADCSHDDKLRILSAFVIKDRLELVIEVLRNQIKSLQGRSRILTLTTTTQQAPSSEVERLRNILQQSGLKDLPSGTSFPPGFLGGPKQASKPDEANELDELKKRLEDAKLSSEASKVAAKELARLSKMNPAQAEYGVCRNYLETLADIPWTKVTEDNLNATVLARARKQLDDDHHGLDKIKKRLLEYLAVLKLKQGVHADLGSQIQHLVDGAKPTDPDAPSANPEVTSAELALREKRRMLDKAPILLLVGPPGTGKTSLAKSVATALGRKFHRISLGGVRDEAEIRGHRRTYVAAMPGVIINALKKCGVANPVILLDEIDKLGHASFQGDPSAAMLEVLDPEQNHTFTDHYVNIPVDLSKVLFIATANSLDTIPPPLLDRMEMIQLSGYTTLEKGHIAERHLLPKQITTNGLTEEQVRLEKDVLNKIIMAYTRESGVRNLEREIGSVCRYKAVEYAEAQDTVSKVDSEVAPTPYNPVVTIEDLDTILGIERFDEEIAERHNKPGIVTGLVAYSTGGQGSILFIEVADMPGKGHVQLTGKLGDVLKESVEVALTWVKSHAFELGLTTGPEDDIMEKRSIHVHCPSGAVPKDGPSAGVAHTIALISLFSGREIPATMAMTGEMSLRGKVMPVGGIKEKLIGALAAGIKTVLIPHANRKDVRDLPTEVKDGLKIVLIKHVREAMREVWPHVHWPGEEGWVGVDSRL